MTRAKDNRKKQPAEADNKTIVVKVNCTSIRNFQSIGIIAALKLGHDC